MKMKNNLLILQVTWISTIICLKIAWIVFKLKNLKNVRSPL